MATITPSRLKSVLTSSAFKADVESNFQVLAIEIAKRKPTYVGGVTTTIVGPPTTGTAVVDQYWRDANLAGYRCTVAGTPGTWRQTEPAIVTSDPVSPPDPYWIIRADLGYTAKFFTSSAWSSADPNAWNYQFSTSTAATDPTAGKLKVDNASVASATAIYLSETDARGLALAAEIASWDDSTSAVRGKLIIRNGDDPSKFAVFAITGANTDNGSWVTLAVTYLTASSTTPFASGETLDVIFSRTGDKGDTGATGAAGSTGATGSAGAAGAGYGGTSTTSFAISASASYAFTTQTGLAYQVGDRVRITSSATGKWMVGLVTGYSGSTLTVQMDQSDGNTSTHTDWNIGLTGETPANTTKRSITFTIGSLGGSNVLTTGEKARLLCTVPGTITKVTTLCDPSGSIVFDIWKDTYANYPATVADSICASAKPTVSSGVKSQDSTLTGWTKTINAGDQMGINIDSVSGCTWAQLIIEFTTT